MRVEWFGQSAFSLSAGEGTLFIDPFGPVSEAMAARGVQFDYPEIAGVSADLALVTHEHLDHNGVEALGGSPDVIRSTAGRLESRFGEVVAIASEHDPRAGTERGPNTIFVFDLEGLRVCHFGDFGQAALRDEQTEAIGDVDLLFLPVGAGPTIDASGADAVVERLRPRWVVPMHYRTPLIGFLAPADAFLERFPDDNVVQLDQPSFEVGELPDSGNGPAVVVPAPPG
jgi:L-ascorbate metabolism protein UlaG (beta-lactamase superfamily)